VIDSTATVRHHLRLEPPLPSRATTTQLIEDARALDKLGRRSEARAQYELAIRSLPANACAMSSMLLRWIARTYEVDTDYAAAEDCAIAAVASAEVANDRNALGHALNVLGAVAWRQGNLDRAAELFHEALERGTTSTDPRLQVDVMTNLGTMAGIRGDFREALRCFQDALAHGRLHSLLDNIVIALNNLGLTNMALGRLDAAEDAFTEALTIADALGGMSTRVQLEVNSAALQIEKRDFAAAKQRCDRAMALAEHLDDARANGEAAKVYGVIARETKDLVAAESHLTSARDIAVAASDLMLEGSANRELAVLFAELGRNRETLLALNRAHACFTQLRSRHELADVGRRMTRLEGDFLDVVRKWGESIESKDHHTQGHCERVADLAVSLAAHVGLDETSLFWFRIGALLHDVGKLIVPAEVLNKPGKLTEDEWALVRQHPAAGEKLLADVQFPWDVAPMVRGHHERWDGQGYPDGLSGERIPLAARILCVADVYDALTTSRSYKRAFSQIEAVEIMRREVGRQFDPALFARFEELVRRGNVGAPSMVKRNTPARRSSIPSRIVVSEEDDLTGALVRRAFVNVTAAVLAERRRAGAPVSLLVIDVDQFKQVNDHFGHLAGDDALRLVAGVMRDSLRPGQYLGRYAGDEFVILLPGLDAAGAGAVAEKIRRITAAMAVPLREDPDRKLQVTLSIGVATAPEHGDSFDVLFNTADRALFDAKREGRDKVVVAGLANAGTPQLVFNRFVGRAKELRSLVLALDESVHGGPQTRVLIGEAGVGKSSLVRQLLPEARLRGAVVVTGRALESESRLPFGPWSEALASIHALGITPPRNWQALSRLVPGLRSTSARAVHDAEAMQGNELMQELVAFLCVASEARPLLLVLEDMHWGDTSSWDTLEYVLAQLTTERISFAVTLRAEEAASGAIRERRQRLTRDERVRELRLERLTSDEVAEWLQSALHRTELGGDLLEYVLRRTEGNAFLVMQLLRAMAEENVFRYVNDAWEWTIPSSLVLPAGMIDLVGRRLSRLPAEALKVLVTAAALGRTFTLSLLTEASGASADVVLDAVDAGLATSVLEPAHEDDGDVYQFAHALLVDAVLKSVSPARRRLTHERIAAILVGRHPDQVNRIATHYASSSNSAEAYRWNLRAASGAMTLYALEEASQFLERALAHAHTDDERVAVHDQIARAAEHSGRWADVERSCDASLTSASLAADSPRALPVRLRRLQARVRLGQTAEDTAAECQALLDVAERVGRLSDVVQARSLLVQILGRAGESERATRTAEGTLRITEEGGDDALIDEAINRLAITLLESHTDEAIAHLTRLIERARSRGDKVMEARAHLTLGVARMRSSDDRAAEEAFRSAQSKARDAHALDFAATASMNLGVIGIRGGGLAAAREALTEALRLYTTLRNNTNRTAALYNLANLERERGDAEVAAMLYRETATLANTLGAGDIAIGAYAGGGLAELRLGNNLAARTSLKSALDALGSRSDWWFQGRELLESLVIRMYARDGEYEAAVARFESAIERLESIDVYAAAWLVGDCAAEIVEHDATLWPAIERIGSHPTVQQFVLLSARFTALHDMAERLDTAYLRSAHR
jgi:diguanylate cyclase (GGDEF)-like protein